MMKSFSRVERGSRKVDSEIDKPFERSRVDDEEKLTDKVDVVHTNTTEVSAKSSHAKPI